jgi:YVTN family beta-propeller protein
VTDDSGYVWVIDTSTNEITRAVPVESEGIPWGVAVNPAGTRVYVTDDSGYVWVIDTSNNTVTATIPVGGDPWGVAVNPAGTRVYVTDGGGSIWVIDTSNNTIAATVPVGQYSIGFGNFIGGPTVASVAPTIKDFGSITSGTSSSAQTFTVSNSGWANLVIATIALTGSNASEFGILNDHCSGVTLAPSSTCTVDVMFSPTSGGTKSGNLSIPSNDPTTPMLNIPLTGIGTYPIISDIPASYDFGFAAIGTGSAMEIFTITNNGLAANLLINSVVITGTDATQFVKQSDNCLGNTLAYLAQCTVGVIFSPTSPGTKSATLSISSNDPTTPILNIALAGSNSVAKIGVFRNGQWFFDPNGNGAWDGCGVDGCYDSFGMAGDIPVMGNWNGDPNRIEKIGAFRNGQWFLDLNGNGAWDGCGTDACYPSFGMAGDIPVVGDWTGTGTAKIGVFRDGQWFLDLNGNGAWDGCGVDGCYTFGMAGDVPVVGDWSGNGTPKIGVFRNGDWFLDYNGDRAWNDCGAPTDLTKDTCYASFGMNAEHPVAGRLGP